MALLEVVHVSKSYPGLPVLDDVSLEMDEGEVVCLLGPSGCGKSTLLHIIAGLERADQGRVLFAGQDLSFVPVHRRGFGLMFQDFALFPHKSVEENVAFGLRMQGQKRAEIEQRVAAALALVRLSGYQQRSVLDLSGGEEQRVALARSLAPNPRLLMLDEPLGSLDRTLREQVMNELRDIFRAIGVTALYVTHDQQEAFAVSDRVCVMRSYLDQGRGGKIEQVGTPQEVYRRPANAYVARFLGFRNLLPGAVLAVGDKNCTIETAAGPLVCSGKVCPPAGAQVTVLVRPEAADVLPAGSTGENVIPGVLSSSSFRGSFYLVATSHPGAVELVTEISTVDLDLPAQGEPLALRLEPSAVTVLAG